MIAAALERPSAPPITGIHDPAFRAALDRLAAAAAPVRFSLATSTADREATFRLRAQVVIDRRWRPASDFPNGCERDGNDDGAVHLAGWLNDDLVATGRLIEPSPFGRLPVETQFDLVVHPRGRVVHLDRLIVARRLPDFGRRIHLALLAVAARETLARGYEVWAGIQSRPMVRLLHLMGFEVQILGPARPYWGEDRLPVRFPLDRAIPGLITLTEPSCDPLGT